jgi:NADPH:quinone reductase-like Zn-dependent oxidoreductase
MTITDEASDKAMSLDLGNRSQAQAEFLMYGRASSMDHGEMNKLCRQVSIESTNLLGKGMVFNQVVPVPDTPPKGARILVVYAGACYRKHRDNSVGSVGSYNADSREVSDVSTTVQALQQIAASVNIERAIHRLETLGSTSPSHCGYRDAALFPGFEVAGVIEALGTELGDDCGYKVGQRVVIYPYEGVPAGYSELFIVPELKYLIPVPDNLSLSVAAMLPTGALLAMSAVLSAHKHVDELFEQRGEDTPVKILIVGTGGLAMWALRIAEQHFYHQDHRHRIELTVASLRDEGLLLAKEEYSRVNVVQWSEDLYERQLIERTKDACNGLVDIVIDFGTTSRSLHRSLQCLNDGGVVLISDDVAEKMLPKFSRKADERKLRMEPVPLGTIEQLHDLVKLVSTNEIKPPPHTVFPCEEASEVVRKLVHSEIPGRAILKFHDIE